MKRRGFNSNCSSPSSLPQGKPTDRKEKRFVSASCPRSLSPLRCMPLLRPPHGILWLYKRQRKATNQGGRNERKNRKTRGETRESKHRDEEGKTREQGGDPDERTENTRRKNPEKEDGEEEHTQQKQKENTQTERKRKEKE